MAIVNGPLFSLDAEGALGKALVYTKWKGRNVVREYVTPANPNSLAQIARRTGVELANLLWGNSTTDQKESWTADAAAGNYSTFNAMTSHNLDEQTENAAPTVEEGASGTAPASDPEFNTVTGGNGKITGTFQFDPSDEAVYACISITPNTGSAVFDYTKLATALYTAGSAPFAFEIPNLQPGTYDISIWTQNEFGQLSSDGDVETDVIVT